MLKRWADWPRGIRWLAGGIAAFLLAVVLAWVLFVPLADWLAHHDVGSAKPALLQTARDAARGRLLTLVAGLFVAGALVFTALNFNLSREGQVTDRYTKAVEQLGSDKLDVRIGGIYGLERVARDSAKDHPTVMEVLTAFIREHSREQWPPSDAGRPEQERLTRPDVQAAVTVTGRRDTKRDILPINLADAELTRAHLRGARLGGADLQDADLTGADLRDADLTGADLTRARLTGAYLGAADLTGADLRDADLADARLAGAVFTGARLSGANLAEADLAEADLTSARLVAADLTGADLTGAVLAFAHLDGADLTGAVLFGAVLANTALLGVRWPEGAQVPAGWMVDSESGRLEPASQLSKRYEPVIRGNGTLSLITLMSFDHAQS